MSSTNSISSGKIELIITRPTVVSLYHLLLCLTFIIAFISAILFSYASKTSLNEPKLFPSPLTPSFLRVK